MLRDEAVGDVVDRHDTCAPDELDDGADGVSLRRPDCGQGSRRSGLEGRILESGGEARVGGAVLLRFGANEVCRKVCSDVAAEVLVPFRQRERDARRCRDEGLSHGLGHRDAPQLASGGLFDALPEEGLHEVETGGGGLLPLSGGGGAGEARSRNGQRVLEGFRAVDGRIECTSCDDVAAAVFQATKLAVEKLLVAMENGGSQTRRSVDDSGAKTWVHLHGASKSWFSGR
ncbi:MAG: hypothetical protein INH37_00560 [Myxococcaceae bacterium]|nr:hypothetical protein [Myxococcaceae bacterium]